MNQEPQDPIREKDQGWRWLAAAAVLVWTGLYFQFRYLMPKKQTLSGVICVVDENGVTRVLADQEISFMLMTSVSDKDGRFQFRYMPDEGDAVLKADHPRFGHTEMMINIALPPPQDLRLEFQRTAN